MFFSTSLSAQDIDCQGLYDEARRTNDAVSQVGYEALSSVTLAALDCYGMRYNTRVGWLMNVHLHSQNQRMRYRESVLLARSFRRKVLQEEDSLSLARIYQRQGVAYFYVGELDSMYWSYQHALALSGAISTQRRLSIYTNIVYLYKKAGLSSRAFSFAQQYEPLFREAVAGDSALVPRLYIFLTTASESAAEQYEKSQQAGLLDQAKALAAEATQLAQRQNDNYRRAFALLAQAGAARLGSDYGYAEFLLLSTEEIQKDIGAVRLDAELLRHQGLLLVAQGQTQLGRERLIEALNVAEQGQQDDLARNALSDLQMLYDQHGGSLAEDLAQDPDSVTGLAVLALALFVSLLGFTVIRYRQWVPLVRVCPTPVPAASLAGRG